MEPSGKEYMTNGKKMLGVGILTFLAITVGSVVFADEASLKETVAAEEVVEVEQPLPPSGQYFIDVAVAEINAFFAEQKKVEAEKAEAERLARVRARSAAPSSSVAEISVGDGSRWDQLAQCETGGNWSTNTGNGYGGGLQFAHQSSWSTWRAFGGEEFAADPWDATREQQIVIAERVLARSGWKAWPGCSRKYGWL